MMNYTITDFNEWQSLHCQATVQTGGICTAHTRPTDRPAGSIVAWSHVPHEFILQTKRNERGFVRESQRNERTWLSSFDIFDLYISHFRIFVFRFFLSLSSFRLPMPFHLKRCAQIQIIKLSNLSLVLCAARNAENTTNASNFRIFSCVDAHPPLSRSRIAVVHLSIHLAGCQPPASQPASQPANRPASQLLAAPRVPLNIFL